MQCDYCEAVVPILRESSERTPCIHFSSDFLQFTISSSLCHTHDRTHTHTDIYNTHTRGLGWLTLSVLVIPDWGFCSRQIQRAWLAHSTKPFVLLNTNRQSCRKKRRTHTSSELQSQTKTRPKKMKVNMLMLFKWFRTILNGDERETVKMLTSSWEFHQEPQSKAA